MIKCSSVCWRWVSDIEKNRHNFHNFLSCCYCYIIAVKVLSGDILYSFCERVSELGYWMRKHATKLVLSRKHYLFIVCKSNSRLEPWLILYNRHKFLSVFRMFFKLHCTVWTLTEMNAEFVFGDSTTQVCFSSLLILINENQWMSGTV